MVRRISFSMTEAQLLDGSKTVTRRLGWQGLKAGDKLLAVDRVMGLKRGERQRVLGQLLVRSVGRERLDAIDEADVAAEGFPGQTPAWFVAHFCRAMRCDAGEMVTRIEFEFTAREGASAGRSQHGQDRGQFVTVGGTTASPGSPGGSIALCRPARSDDTVRPAARSGECAK